MQDYSCTTSNYFVSVISILLELHRIPSKEFWTTAGVNGSRTRNNGRERASNTKNEVDKVCCSCCCCWFCGNLPIALLETSKFEVWHPQDRVVGSKFGEHNWFGTNKVWFHRKIPTPPPLWYIKLWIFYHRLLQLWVLHSRPVLYTV
jgi:hypothetical protein